MKTYKILASVVFLLLAASMISTSAYTPQDEGFVQVQLYTMADDRENVVIGNQVEFSIWVQNYWNDTMSNITITQEFRANAELMSIVGETVNAEETSFEDLSITDERSGRQLEFNYLNATAENFTANLDITLLEDEFFTIDFVLNFTELGTYNFNPPTMTYYDHWGDRKTSINSIGTEVIVIELIVEDRRQYIPTFTTDEPNYTLIVGALLAIFIVAILGRVLHFKKPIEL